MKSLPTNFIDRLKKQKEDALHYIIDVYMPLVKTITKKILNTHSQQDIDECINDVFLSVWQNSTQFQGDTNDFKKWIGMITKYKAIDRYRQNEKRIAREQSDTPLHQHEANYTTEHHILMREQKNELLFALSQLAELDRHIFIMKYYLELTNSEIADEQNGIYIPPYDDPLIMAGQGTVALEILQQLHDIDAIVVPIGGGGLISGILTAVKETNPAIQIIGVEPELANDTYLSLHNKKITAIPATNTIADGLRTNQPGDLTFPVLAKYLDDLVLVSEDEIRMTFSVVLERTKQFIEPSSATTVAAVLYNKLNMQGKNIVTLISGGNVDLETVQELIVDTTTFSR